MMLTDRVAIVTGGAAGIGEAIVRRFAHEGAAVSILDRDLQAAERVAATLAGADVSCVACDVSIDANVAAAIDSVLARYKKIDILVNNAGIASTSTPISDFSEDAWDEMLDIHAKGCFLCTKRVFPQMKRQRRGSIVNISSLGGLRGRPLRHAYIAAKHAIVGLTKSTALEGIADNIRVNAIAPGPVDTRRRFTDLDPEQHAREWRDHQAAGGSDISFVIRPEAIAWAALFLASDESVNITGIVLPVDGGIMAGSLERGRLRFPAR